MASYIWHDWMVTELNLKGNEVLVYSMIYSFSQDGDGTCFKSQSSLAEELGITRRATQKILDRLIDRGLIERSEGAHKGTHTNDYSVVCEKSSHRDAKKVRTRVRKKFAPECEKSSHNNKTDNKDDNKNINPSKRVREEEIKLEYAEGVSMSENEYGRLCDRFGKEDTDLAIEYLSLYKQEKNYKTKSDSAAIHRWVMNAARKDKAEKEALERKGIRSAEKEAERERKRAEMEAKSQEILRKYEMED